MDLLGAAKLLAKSGKSEDAIGKVQRQANLNQASFFHQAIEDSLVSAEELCDICATEFGLPIVDISQFNLNSIDDELLNYFLIEKHHCLPLLKKRDRVYIATFDPTNSSAAEDFRFTFGLHIQFILANKNKLDAVIEKVLHNDQLQFDLSSFDAEEFANIEVADTQATDDEEPEQDDAPIVIYINKILIDAINKGASDLHFEPYEHNYRIRFRIDGVLKTIAEPPISLANRISARLKVMSKLDIAERRLPQDGRIKLKISKNRAIDFRVSTLPTLWGEKIVMRILDSSTAMLGIDKLGYEKEQQILYEQALSQPQGMILVTGPTGSGKTVSLYTGLNILNTESRNISTAEDPVEINLAGINQVHINTKTGLTFANVLRSFLRQDPDVVMVGEIRDLETAEIAIKASQTGHLVLSTLHTNSAAETLTRLLNMGVPSYNISSSISLIIAQRLLRKLCPDCKIPEILPTQQLKAQGFTDEDLQSGLQIYQANGCDKCSEGYKGRIGIYEVLPMTNDIAKIIMAGGGALEISAQMKKDNIPSLRRSALLKVSSGVSSLSEANRITSQ
ncbi:type IV-A pilus assembly ATPase PilB [Paraferrimonas sp. SM1919]|uniref:type IV-A pilus assembly ATPase PilB n=1 Tax=Paraferrimonas sp. SM1919 TaxID=2662263 RepID=UPI0013D6D4C3|nr:type IV-A pilus assembly ATPase PilB [Paraferrimonas sp. SM1919]